VRLRGFWRSASLPAALQTGPDMLVLARKTPVFRSGGVRQAAPPSLLYVRGNQTREPPPRAATAAILR